MVKRKNKCPFCGAFAFISLPAYRHHIILSHREQWREKTNGGRNRQIEEDWYYGRAN